MRADPPTILVTGSYNSKFGYVGRSVFSPLFLCNLINIWPWGFKA